MKLFGGATKILTTPGELGYMDPVDIDGTIPNAGETSAGSGAQNDYYRGPRSDSGYVTLWSYTIDAAEKATVDSLHIFASPSGLWDVVGAQRVRGGTYFVQVDGTTIMEGQVEGHDHFVSAIYAAAGTAGPFTRFKAERFAGLGPVFNANQVITVLYTPTTGTFGGIMPSVVRTSVHFQGSSTADFQEATYCPADATATQTVFSYTVPANNHKLQNLLVQVEIGKNIIAHDVVVRINGTTLIDLGHITFHVGCSTPARYVLPLGGITFGSNTLIEVIGRPMLDTGGTINAFLVGAVAAAVTPPRVGSPIIRGR